MDETNRQRIRYIFLTPRPSVALMTAAEHLGMSSKWFRFDSDGGEGQQGKVDGGGDPVG
jgi:hypothetical protein